MSASLVGSEMCIRDSPCSSPGGDPAPWTPATGASAAPEAPIDGIRGEAVSYTHLTLPTICSV
eukprot:9574635-Alexandrium_andersonii.AAC.1